MGPIDEEIETHEGLHKLVGGLNPSKKYEFVNDEIPNISGKIKN